MSAKATTAASTEVPFSIKKILAPLAAIIVGIFMVVLDGTAVNVALPGLVGEFHSLVSSRNMDGHRLCPCASRCYSTGRLVV